MEEIRTGLGRWQNGYKANLLKYAYQRNPDSLLDETLLSIWALMLLACGFTIAFGAYYHYQMLQNAFGVGVWSVVGSFAVFLALEIAKIYFGLVFTRSLFSGLWWKSIYRAMFTLLIGLIVVVAFKWSIGISTKGVSQVNLLNKTTELYQSQQFTPPPSVAIIDEQIAALEVAVRAGAKATWKGSTTQQGLKTISTNTKLKSDLIAQKSAIIAAAQSQFDSLQQIGKAEISATATLLTDYGGKAEWAQIVFILLIVLFEFINYSNNRATQPDNVRQLHTVTQPTPPQPTQRPFSTNTIGFKLPDTKAETLVSQATQPTQSPPTQPPTHQHTTTVVVAPSVDLSQVKNHCREYYKRSVKPSSDPDTRERNRGKYLEFRRTLELAGFEVTELENGFLDIKTVAA